MYDSPFTNPQPIPFNVIKFKESASTDSTVWGNFASYDYYYVNDFISADEQNSLGIDFKSNYLYRMYYTDYTQQQAADSGWATHDISYRWTDGTWLDQNSGIPHQISIGTDNTVILLDNNKVALEFIDPYSIGFSIGPLTLGEGSKWTVAGATSITFRLSATGTDAQKGPYRGYYTAFSTSPDTFYSQYGVRYYTNTGTWDGECHFYINPCATDMGDMTQTADGTVTLYDSSDPPKVMVTFQNPYSSVSSAPALPGPPAVANIPGPTVGSGTLPDLPSVVAPGPDVVFSVASHPTAFDAGNATLRYYFTTDNHALLSIENVDHDAGTATLVPRAAFDLVDAFEPKPKMHLTFEGAAAGDSSRDVIPAGVTVGTYPRGAEGVSAYGSYAADFLIASHPGDDTDPAERLETGYALGTKQDFTVAVWHKTEFDQDAVEGDFNTVIASSDYHTGEQTNTPDTQFIVYMTLVGVDKCPTGKMRFYGYFLNTVDDVATWSQFGFNVETSQQNQDKLSDYWTCVNIADWHHVAISVTGSTSGGGPDPCSVVLYINGTPTHPNKDLCAGDIDFGSQTLFMAGIEKYAYAGDRYYDELQVWDSALSAQQVSDLYAAFTTPSTSGQATITVKAVAVERAVDSWFADQTFAVTVSAGAPSVALALPDVSGTQTIDLTQYFDDPQGDHTLTYSLTVEDPNVVNATLVGTTLYVQNGLFRDGNSLVTVTATDGFSNVSDALNASYSFSFSFNTEYVYSLRLKPQTFSDPYVVSMKRVQATFGGVPVSLSFEAKATLAAQHGY